MENKIKTHNWLRIEKFCESIPLFNGSVELVFSSFWFVFVVVCCCWNFWLYIMHLFICANAINSLFLYLYKCLYINLKLSLWMGNISHCYLNGGEWRWLVWWYSVGVFDTQWKCKFVWNTVLLSLCEVKMWFAAKHII